MCMCVCVYSSMYVYMCSSNSVVAVYVCVEQYFTKLSIEAYIKDTYSGFGMQLAWRFEGVGVGGGRGYEGK